jgi:hypothetical protein
MALKLPLSQPCGDASSGWRCVLSLTPREFPEPPFQAVSPVDQIEMADSYKGALVFAPLT